MINLEQAQQKVMSKEKGKKLCSNAVKMQRLKHNKKVNKKYLGKKVAQNLCPVKIIKTK